MSTHYFSTLVACSQNALSCSIQPVHLCIRLRSTITYIRFGWSKRGGPFSNACCNNNIRIPSRVFNVSHHWRTADYRSCELDIRSERCALTLWLTAFEFILITLNCICGHFNGFSSMSFLYTDNVPNNCFLLTTLYSMMIFKGVSQSLQSRKSLKFHQFRKGCLNDCNPVTHS